MNATAQQRPLATCATCGELFFNAGSGNSRVDCYACHPQKGPLGDRETREARIASHKQRIDGLRSQLLLEVGRVVRRGGKALEVPGLLAQEVLTLSWDKERTVGSMARQIGTSRRALMVAVAELERRGLVFLRRPPRSRRTWVTARHTAALQALSPEPGPADVVSAPRPVEPAPAKAVREGACDTCGERKPLTTKTTCGACVWAGARLKGGPVTWPIIDCEECADSFQRSGPGQGRRSSCYDCKPPKSGRKPRGSKVRKPAAPAPTPEPEPEEQEEPAELVRAEVAPSVKVNGATTEEPMLRLAGQALLAVGARRASKWLGGWADRFEQKAREVVG